MLALCALPRQVQPQEANDAGPCRRTSTGVIGKFRSGMHGELPLRLIFRPEWRNWQTRTTQNRVGLRPCRFDPDLRHQLLFIYSKHPVVEDLVIVLTAETADSFPFPDPL